MLSYALPINERQYKFVEVELARLDLLDMDADTGSRRVLSFGRTLLLASDFQLVGKLRGHYSNVWFLPQVHKIGIEGRIIYTDD